MQKPFINEFKEKDTFYSKRGRQIPDEFASSSCFFFQTKTDLVVVKFYHNAAVFWKLLENLQGSDNDEIYF